MFVLLGFGILGGSAGVVLYRGTAGEVVAQLAVTPLPDNPPAAKPMAQPLVIGNESNGKTISVVVGQSFDVQLAGTQPGTGWEGGQVKGEAVRHLNSGAPPDPRPSRPGLQALPFGSEFLPTPGAADKAIGTYVFCYRAVKEGRAEISMSYVTPSGPGVTQRRRSALIAEFKVTIDVTANPPKASEPAVKDGLAVTVAPIKAVFGVNEPLEFKIELANTGKETFVLPGLDTRKLQPHYVLVIKEVGKDWSWLPMYKVNFQNNLPSLRLDGGEKRQEIVSFPAVDYQWGGGGQTVRIGFPKIGKYEVYLTVAVPEVGGGKVRWWKGTLTTKPAEFEIAAKRAEVKSQTLFQEGLATTTVLPRSVFAADEKPSFQINYENRTDKAIRLLDVGYEVSYITFTSVADDKEQWQAFPRGHLYNERPAVGRPPNSEPGQRKAREPVIATVEPGKTAVTNVAVAGKFSRRLPPLPDGQERPNGGDVVIRETLPPGKYLLRATIEFRTGKDDNAPAFWIGKITTNPLEFEVAAPAQGQAKEDLIKQLDLKWQICVRRYQDLNRQVTVLMLRLDRSQQKEDKQAAEILKRLLEWQVAGEEGALHGANVNFAPLTLQRVKGLRELNDHIVEALPKVQAAYRNDRAAIKAINELAESLNAIDKALDGLLKDRLDIKDGLGRLQKELEKEILP
jgi:hypothetical protein